MREILFRGKDTLGYWLYGGFHLWETRQPCVMDDKLKPEEIKHIIIQNSFADWNMPRTMQPYIVIPETIGQYTGLTDKNGTKIFEGDIVQYTDEEGYYPEDCCDFVGKIVLEHGAFGIATNDNIPIDLDNWCDNDNFVSLWELYWNLEPEGEMLSSIEVIGNIHDNPELLKECNNG